MKYIVIYTDGACSGNPGPGGYGALLMYKEYKKELHGGSLHTTNNRMEITAAIKALEAVKEPCEIHIYTDSAYLCKTFDEKWIYGWIKNNWLTSTKKPVENKDLWLILYALVKQHNVTWHKVKGHSSNEYNNRCDELARLAIKEKCSDCDKCKV